MHRPAHYWLNIAPEKSFCGHEENFDTCQKEKEGASRLKRNGNYFFDTLHKTSPIESGIKESTWKK